MLECVNGEYGDYYKALTEQATNPTWLNQPESEGLSETAVNKLNEANRCMKRQRSSLTPPLEKTKHIYPPPEWVRLWMLIGRCHVQFFRDWVNIHCYYSNCFKENFIILQWFFVHQTVTYLKLAVHIMCAILIGMLFGDSGSNATKQVSNLSSYICHCLYLWYTTMMPGILRCKYLSTKASCYRSIFFN